MNPFHYKDIYLSILKQCDSNLYYTLLQLDKAIKDLTLDYIKKKVYIRCLGLRVFGYDFTETIVIYEDNNLSSYLIMRRIKNGRNKDKNYLYVKESKSRLSYGYTFNYLNEILFHKYNFHRLSHNKSFLEDYNLLILEYYFYYNIDKRKWLPFYINKVYALYCDR